QSKGQGTFYCSRRQFNSLHEFGLLKRFKKVIGKQNCENVPDLFAKITLMERPAYPQEIGGTLIAESYLVQSLKRLRPKPQICVGS
ncbi:MAG: hypothetical protein AAF528_12395, partial [Cyanobacteria bacterium P01_C01_bin.121]